ncbi:hypothetical protein ACFWXK_02775 [Streptomyces sp. NPDC059070]|uniref:hypothetical protein n=1 Tax=unclassified Streptomyces TaxID=2593676 RepID=UPI0034E2F2E5
MGLAALLGAAAIGWTAIALSVHTNGSTPPEPGGVTDAELARLGAAVMAGLAATAAGLWWRHWTVARRASVGGGWARGAFALSAVHALFVLPVIVFASWSWKALAIAFTCAVVAGGVREAAEATSPADRGTPAPLPVAH